MKIALSFNDRPIEGVELLAIPTRGDLIALTTIEGGPDMLTTADVQERTFVVHRVDWRCQPHRETTATVVLHLWHPYSDGMDG